MQIELTFLKSKVARRVFTLFVSCALVPIIALAIISFSQVTDQLYKQSCRRLQESTKAMGMSIFERLNFLQNELKLLTSELENPSQTSILNIFTKYEQRLRKRFQGLFIIQNQQVENQLFGKDVPAINISAKQLRYLASGNPLLQAFPSADERIRLFLMLAVKSGDTGPKIICAQLKPLYLWGFAEQRTLPSMTELCILDQSGRLIYTTTSLTPDFYKNLDPQIKQTTAGNFEWQNGDSTYLASFWDIFLKPHFSYPKLTVVLSTSRDYIFEPITYFKKMFPFIVLLSLWVVLLLSIIQIRKTMNPLEKLKIGTRQIAQRNFESKVHIASGDEFEELAGSFNDMARQLGRQFKALTTMAEIDRAILSALDTEKIINTALTRWREFFKYDYVGFILLESRKENTPIMYASYGDHNEIKVFENLPIMSDELEALKTQQELFLNQSQDELPSYMLPIAGSEPPIFVLLPILVKEEIAGAVILGFSEASPPEQEDLEQARRMSNQIAVALSNARLLEELETLNRGTLTTLARTVDAKSSWTAGHSERVTETALSIGQILGLEHAQLENLRRGALLHDIGKIGTPVAILDKPGKLTTKEYDIIKQHPRIGARILEPITTYSSIIPMVLQHHEHFDGKGYPDGIAGQDICLEARILAVADVFDALSTDRPYRQGMELQVAIDIIKENSGTQFDPEVVKAFLEVVEQKCKATQ